MPHLSETSIKDPLNPWRRIKLLLPVRFNFLTPNSMKTVSAICIFALFSLYFSASHIAKWRFCPRCNGGFVRGRSRVQVISSGSVPVEAEEKTNISHILFGISGSAKTWSRRRHYSELWWKPNVTRGFVWLDERLEPWHETAPPYKVSADTARFKYTCRYGSRSAVRIARIVKESFELGLDNVRWFVMGDDDTVFFTENLVDLLNKYDHREMYYIGGNSESVQQDVVHSYSMGYGGGGFAISRPLAAALVEVLDGCIDRYAAFYGSDQKIGACMSEIGVPLTKELGFHQLDIRGSPYGLLSAHPPAPLISLHHLDYLLPLFPETGRIASVRKLIDAYKSDPARALQHTFCYDPTRNWSVSVSWGYSVQLYPFPVAAKDLTSPLQTFLTWAWSGGPFTFNTRVMKLDPCERPIVYFLEGVEDEEGRTVTRYRGNDSVRWRKCERGIYKVANLVKGFDVSAGLLDPRFWYQASRRQRCQITGSQDGVVQVSIRGRNQWESVSQ